MGYASDTVIGHHRKLCLSPNSSRSAVEHRLSIDQNICRGIRSWTCRIPRSCGPVVYGTPKLCQAISVDQSLPDPHNHP